MVLVEPNAAVRGEPAIFYDLVDGTFCGNPAWSSCPHRLACIKCLMHIGIELDASKLIMRPERVTEEHLDPCLEPAGLPICRKTAAGVWASA
jgi:hypothetical protein